MFSELQLILMSGFPCDHCVLSVCYATKGSGYVGSSLASLSVNLPLKAEANIVCRKFFIIGGISSIDSFATLLCENNSMILFKIRFCSSKGGNGMGADRIFSLSTVA